MYDSLVDGLRWEMITPPMLESRLSPTRARNRVEKAC